MNIGIYLPEVYVFIFSARSYKIPLKRTKMFWSISFTESFSLTNLLSFHWVQEKKMRKKMSRAIFAERF